MVELKSNKCCGCSACVNICPKQCIHMKPDEEGFTVPEVNKSECISCSLCEKVCPALNEDRENTANTKCIDAFYGYNINEPQRLMSSSGGVFVLLAQSVLKNNGIVYGAALTEDCYRIEHIPITTNEQLNRILGSKYVQSTLEYQFKEIKQALEEEKQVLFCGTPCQVSGLQGYLNKQYTNLLCVDFICHGVPSQKAWKSYLSYLESKYGQKITSFSFRNKDTGWHFFSTCYSFYNNNKIITPFDEDAWGKMFIRNNGLREVCYQCGFKRESRADITIADAWGIEQSHPELDDDKGTSLIFVRTRKGSSYVEMISDNMHLIHCDKREMDLLLPRTQTVANRHPQRDDFYKHIGEIGFDKIIKRFCKPSLRNIIGQTLRRMKRISNR